MDPFDPFADDDDAPLLVVPPDMPDYTGPITGWRAIFVESAPVDATRWRKVKICGDCEQVMVTPDSFPKDGERLFIICPERHYSTTITVPQGYVLGGEHT
jgi:hypothetical protein